MTTYYHVSQIEHPIGTTLRAGQRPVPLAAYRSNWIDATFDAGAPVSLPQRQSCLFAFDRLAPCIAFAPSGCPTFFYEVELGNPVHVAPWELTAFALFKGSRATCVPSVISEYWSPQHSWAVYEFLSDSMTIVADVSAQVGPPSIQNATIKGGVIYALGIDRAQCNGLWP